MPDSVYLIYDNAYILCCDGVIYCITHHKSQRRFVCWIPVGLTERFCDVQ